MSSNVASRHSRLVIVAIVGGAVAWLLGFAAVARPATFTVTKTADTADGACTVGDCSLREAVGAANASAGLDSVSIPAGTYVLTLAGSGEDASITGDLDITDSVVIKGAGSASTILDGNLADRVLDIRPPVPASGTPLDVTVQDLAIQRGAAGNGDGGGIYRHDCVGGGNPQVLGSTTLLRSIVRQSSGSTGGGLGVYCADLTVESSTVTQNIAIHDGGGIGTLNGDVQIKGSTVTNNTAGQGAGLELVVMTLDETPTVYIERTTVSGNKAIGSSSVAAIGGGVYVAGAGSFTLAASTVSGNTATLSGGGVLVFANVTSTILNSTLSANQAGDGAALLAYSGGMRAGMLAFQASTVAANAVTSGNGAVITGEAVAPILATTAASSLISGTCKLAFTSSAGYNVESPGNTCGFAAAGDQSNVADPKLGALAANGGTTQTHALLPGSPAIDRLAPVAGVCPATDQRAITRPKDGDGNGTALCDAGAVERQSSGCASIVVCATVGRRIDVDLAALLIPVAPLVLARARRR